MTPMLVGTLELLLVRNIQPKQYDGNCINPLTPELGRELKAP